MKGSHSLCVSVFAIFSFASISVQASTTMWGDINNDREVNTADVLLATKSVLGQALLSNEQLARGNIAPLINGLPQPLDPYEALNAGDLLLILQIALGINKVPAFFSGQQNISITHGNANTVYVANATDINSDVLSYSISGGVDANLFEINSLTGELIFSATPNYYIPDDNDKNNIYQLELTVTDGLLTSTMVLLINVYLPNILFISIDDLNDWIEPLGVHPETITPNINDLASRGVMFTNAHASAPSCNPSRTSVMTGLSPNNSGVLSNSHKPMRDYIPPNHETILQYFQNNNYYTAGMGKIFHTLDNYTEPWDEYGGISNTRPTPIATPYHGLTELPAAIDWGPSDGLDSDWGEERIATYGENFFSRTHQKPFFLSLGFNLPHLKWYVPHNNWNKFPLEPTLPPYLENDRDDMPIETVWFGTNNHRVITEGGKWYEAVRAYLASINFVDDQVGRVLSALDNSDYVNNTIVVLWSDHGYHLGEKDAWLKSTLWEESTRVPLIMIVPGVTPQNTVSVKAVSLLDLYPTLVELAGLPQNPNIDGVSLLELLRDPINGTREIDYAITSIEKGSTIRDERWRYTKYLYGGEELYDHQNDPNEHTNLSEIPAYSEIKQLLSTKLNAGTTF